MGDAEHTPSLCSGLHKPRPCGLGPLPNEVHSTCVSTPRFRHLGLKKIKGKGLAGSGILNFPGESAAWLWLCEDRAGDTLEL